MKITRTSPVWMPAMESPLGELAGPLGESGGQVAVRGEPGGWMTAWVAGLAAFTGRLCVTVAADAHEARRIAESLATWEGEAGIHSGGVALLAGSDASPYLEIAPDRALGIQRLATLHRLMDDDRLRHLVLDPVALSARTLPKEDFLASCRTLQSGQEVDREALVECLDTAGFVRVGRVEDPGTYSVRGGVVDIFSPLDAEPARLDFFGSEIESIRAFLPETQRTGGVLERVEIIPVREALPTEAARQHAQAALHVLAGELGHPTRRVRAIAEDLDAGILTPGLDGLLPAFFEELSTISAWLPPDVLWVLAQPEAVSEGLERHAEALLGEHGRAVERGALVFPVERLTWSPERIQETWETANVVRWRTLVGDGDGGEVQLSARDHGEWVETLRSGRGSGETLQAVAQRVQELQADGLAVGVATQGMGGAERIREALTAAGIPCQLEESPLALAVLAEIIENPRVVRLGIGSIHGGFDAPSLGLAILDEGELLGAASSSRQRRRRAPDSEVITGTLQSLEPGDLVVHVDHGIARYLGLIQLDFDDIPGDFVHLEFHGNDKLYLPVDRLSRVQRHVAGDDRTPRLNKLGGSVWETTRSRVRKNLLVMARRLVETQARREGRERVPYSEGGDFLRELAAGFPYEETHDQSQAIAAVAQDMAGIQPMDRLVCGDVGFGKTEVALRATIQAVEDGRQVVVLVPTTVLAQQHQLTFERRFEGFPVRVCSLTRRGSTAHQRAVLEGVAGGDVDVLIGTHRLLANDVVFRELGLVIIDEEHRFGVRQKERLKELRDQVDVLTLSATPIPRTLHFAMSGLRDMSVIATPPPNRLAVRTVVARDGDALISEAIRRELRRGGQVFFVHNRVATIDARADHVRTLIPESRVVVAHGQMRAGGLAKIMRTFLAGEANVLVSTTIIESGLDIPRANTLIIDQAHLLGLAELHQLRGRVGRSSVRAWAYLLVPPLHGLPRDAARRIRAIQKSSELGGGFQIANHDLSIRGAGNILGAQQSGHIHAIGYELYVDMLAEALAEQRGERPRTRIDPELQMAIPAYIPTEYCPDTGLRLRFYKEFATAGDVLELEEAWGELVDRCGRPPEAVQGLLQLGRIKVEARHQGCLKVLVSGAEVALSFHPEGPIPLGVLLAFLKKRPAGWRASPNGESFIRQFRCEKAGDPIAMAVSALGEVREHAVISGVFLGDGEPC